MKSEFAGMADRNALITGAAGFVGGALSRYLREQGWTVLSTDTAAPPEKQGWRACDIRDAAQVDALFEWAGPVSHVFHLAAITFVPESGKDPATTFDVNLIGTGRIAAAMCRHVPAARMVYVSSSEVYGHPLSLPVSEEHPLNPVNPYAISKAAADLHCAYLHQAGELDVVRMRPFNHSGPGQSDRFVLSSFARQVAQIEAGQIPPVLRVGNLEAARDFAHARDIVRGYEAAALHGAGGEAYNICSGCSVVIREALERLLDLSEASIRLEVDADRLRAVEVPETRGSYEKLAQDTGWQPEADLDELLRDLLAYWRAEEG